MITVQLFNYIYPPFGSRDVDSPVPFIVKHRVGFAADRKCRHFKSRVAIKHDNTCRIAATYKQPAVRLVKGHRVVALCFRQLPSTDDFRFAAIDHKNAVRLRYIDKKAAAAHFDSERFRMTRKLDLGQLFHRV